VTDIGALDLDKLRGTPLGSPGVMQ